MLIDVYNFSIMNSDEYDYVPSNPTLWKYMDLSKFLYMINNKKLYFTKTENFSDNLEGIPSNEIIKDKILEFKTNLLKKIKINNNSKNYRSIFYNTFYEKKLINNIDIIIKKINNNLNEKSYDKSKINIQNIIEDDNTLIKSFKNDLKDYVKKYMENIKKNSFISCWRAAEKESQAMWDLYTKKYGILIKTNLEKLVKNINEDDNICFHGFVSYINENSNLQYKYKKKFFENIKKMKLLKIYLKNIQFFLIKKIILNTKKNIDLL